MTNDTPDKTKVKITTPWQKQKPDATRLSALKKKNVAQSKSDQISDKDKTRLQPSVDRTILNDLNTNRNNSSLAKSDQGKTRIARRQPADVAKNDNATQFKPGHQQTDKTRIAPSTSQQKEVDRSGEDRPQTKQSRHRVLKERFVLESVLGSGGMGVVYKAKDLLKVEAQDRDPYVAIKVLSEEFKAHPEAFISLQRESRKSQRIAHPNIVNVYDFDRDEDTVFMTMEFMDGCPLDEKINQYRATGLPTDDCWDIFSGLCSALSHAHSEHIIHSDFKPGNIFVTKKGTTKVFDFGIARAVAEVERMGESTGDITVFDAGNLGALTPAYASVEMLEGQNPDLRDDIFALGCVTYEMFTGEHPYNKVPADEAERQGLKPERIQGIKNYQWRAIEKSISFRREDRPENIDQFVGLISPKIKNSNRMIVILSVLMTIVAVSYIYFMVQKPIEPTAPEFDISGEKLKIRIDFYRENIEKLLGDPSFTDPWQRSIWSAISDLKALVGANDPWLASINGVIYQLYSGQIKFAIDGGFYNRARRLIESAKKYTDNVSALEVQMKLIDAAIFRDKENEQKLANEANEKQKKLLAIKRTQEKSRKKTKAVLATKKETGQKFDVALNNVNIQLNCQGRLNMRDLETAVVKLEELDHVRYSKLRDKIVKSLADCIVNISHTSPERALEAKKHSMRIFKSNQLLAGIEIVPRDVCDRSLAGLGSRGKRASCKDKIGDSDYGPELVVIPASSKINAFAIGKYEVSIEQMNAFCKEFSSCRIIKGPDKDFPASNISISVVKEYLKWLSNNTNSKYRLPTKNEWLHAARSRSKFLDPNRNCKLNTRGIEKGGDLVKANIGKRNGWGLVNYVGNVQEWVYAPGRKLIAIGGSYRQSMEECDIATSQTHDGQPDKSTGFRVVRELKG